MPTDRSPPTTQMTLLRPPRTRHRPTQRFQSRPAASAMPSRSLPATRRPSTSSAGRGDPTGSLVPVARLEEPGTGRVLTVSAPPKVCAILYRRGPGLPAPANPANPTTPTPAYASNAKVIPTASTTPPSATSCSVPASPPATPRSIHFQLFKLYSKMTTMSSASLSPKPPAPPATLDYSLTGVNSTLAVEKGLAEADWYTCPIPRDTLRKLLERRDGPAIRDTLISGSPCSSAPARPASLSGAPGGRSSPCHLQRSSTPPRSDSTLA
jgi:hypothetical protein